MREVKMPHTCWILEIESVGSPDGMSLGLTSSSKEEFESYRYIFWEHDRS